MKYLKFTSILFVLVCMILTISGCSNKSQKQDIAGTGKDTSNEIVYKVPEQAVSIDMNAEDPSNEEVQFSYDESGRVTQCRYNYEAHEIYLSYDYQDSSVHIYAFSDGIVAADETFELPGGFDSKVGFKAYKGYYFNGYQF